MLDTNIYPTGINVSVSVEELEKINLVRDQFHGDWKYCIAPSILWSYIFIFSYRRRLNIVK